MTPLADPADAAGFRPGGKVSVTAEDTGRDPVVGERVRPAANGLALRRDHPAVGTVVVNFPRAGYGVRRA